MAKDMLDKYRYKDFFNYDKVSEVFREQMEQEVFRAQKKQEVWLERLPSGNALYTLDVPGVRREDLELTQSGNELVASYSRRGKKTVVRWWIGNGAVVAAATLKDGVLQVAVGPAVETTKIRID